MDAAGQKNVAAGWRTESSVGAQDVRVDRQWVGGLTLGERIVAAARAAVAMHIEAEVREQSQPMISVQRTQAASLAILAERVRAEAKAKREPTVELGEVA